MKQPGEGQSGSEWSPLRHNGDEQHILNTRHHQQVASTRGNGLRVHLLLWCGTQYILYDTKWCWSRGQRFAWMRLYQLETVRNYRWDPSRKVVVWQFALASIGIFPGDDPALDTMSMEMDLEINGEAEDRILHRMAKAQDLFEMWQGG